jgi:hypothetical protein
MLTRMKTKYVSRSVLFVLLSACKTLFSQLPGASILRTVEDHNSSMLRIGGAKNHVTALLHPDEVSLGKQELHGATPFFHGFSLSCSCSCACEGGFASCIGGASCSASCHSSCRTSCRNNSCACDPAPPSTPTGPVIA